MEDKKKVIVYVDGFNFYYGLKSKKWKMSPMPHWGQAALSL